MDGVAFGPIINPTRTGRVRLGGRVLVGTITVGSEFTTIESQASEVSCHLRVIHIEWSGGEVLEVESNLTPTLVVEVLEELDADLSGLIIRGGGAGRTSYFADPRPA